MQCSKHAIIDPSKNLKKYSNSIDETTVKRTFSVFHNFPTSWPIFTKTSIDLVSEPKLRILYSKTIRRSICSLHQWRSQPDNLVPLCNFKVLSLFISLEIDCFHSQSTVNICIAGLNRWAGYATGLHYWYSPLKLLIFQYLLEFIQLTMAKKMASCADFTVTFAKSRFYMFNNSHNINR